MKLLPTIAAMMISFAAFGQEASEAKTSTEFKRLSLGLNISPDYCYRSLTNNDGSEFSSRIIDVRNAIEKQKIAYTGGINANYSLSKSIAIESGLQYSNKGYAISYSDLTFGDMIDPRYGYVYDTLGLTVPIATGIIYNHIYLDIPLRAIISLGERRLRYVASIGIVTNILLKATQTTVSESLNGDKKRETKTQLEDFKTLNFSPMISVGLDYKVNDRLNLRAEPTFRYGLLKIIDAPVSAYLWTAGLNISCYYRL
jgi:hypothetical protein